MIIIPKRNRATRIFFRVSEPELKLIEQKMQQACIVNREAYLRKMAIDGYVIHLDLTAVRELVRLLGNTTNNINQIARRVNKTGNLYKSDVEDLQERYEQLWSKAEGIIRALADISA